MKYPESMRRLYSALLILSSVCLVSAVPANAQSATTEMTLEDAQYGSLMIEGSQPGRYSRLSALSTRINVEVTGMLARYEIEQTFVNPQAQWLEATYVFPLPDDATVDQLTMKIGDREIVGQIQSREQARKTYRKARATGQRTTLVERQRGNLFTSKVANIAPSEKIKVTIGFQSQTRYDDGIFHLSLPMTITQRYLPGRQLKSHRTSESVLANSNGWGYPTKATHQVPDGSEISPPMTSLAPPASINIVLNSGIPIEQITSNTHQIEAIQHDTRWYITPVSGSIPMDRDFNLSWQPIPGGSPLAAVFTQTIATEAASEQASYLSLMLIPPQELYEDTPPAREVIFVIDKSGSMGGTSMPAAKKALRQGIQRLTEGDHFNVISFNDSSTLMFDSSVTASTMNKQRAIARVQLMSAGGGTDILEAFRDTLKHQSSNDKIRQIVFITDGSVGNEAEIFKYVRERLGTNRVFTVGIGSAPNKWFMRKIAEIGRGTYTYIPTASEVDPIMQSLFYKLERPAMTNIALKFEGMSTPEFYPQVIPDLYAGEPVLIDARSVKSLDGGQITVTGNQNGIQWQRSFQVDTATSFQQTGLDKLWAHRKIESLENSLLFAEDQTATIKTATDTALQYGLVSKYTSLVAVDQNYARNMYSEPLASQQIPLASPAGSTATHAAAPNVVVSTPYADPIAVPETNLGIILRLLLSLFLTSLVGMYAKLTGKKKHASA